VCPLEGGVAYYPRICPQRLEKNHGRCNMRKTWFSGDQNDGISKFVLDPNWETNDGSIPIEWGFNLMDPI